MNLVKGIATAVLVFLFGASGTLFAADMSLTLDDGREVILHEDGSWGFAKFSVSEGDEEDIYITVDDGRTICMKTDNTWSFTKQRPPEKKSFAELPTVNATTTSTKPTLDVAVKAASDEALKRAADRLVPYAKKSKMTHKYLVACIKNEIGDNGIETTYKPGWTAQAKISLQRVQVQKILECVNTQIEAQAQESAAAKDTAKAAK